MLPKQMTKMKARDSDPVFVLLDSGHPPEKYRSTVWKRLALVLGLILSATFAMMIYKLTEYDVINNNFSVKKQKYKSAAVAADAGVCSNVGADILRKNGSAVDSAVASILCLGVVQIHSCGIGGGGFMVVYERALEKFFIYDYREVAPAGSSEDMFLNNPEKAQYGGAAVGVPGMVRGLWQAHKRHGKLKWSQVVEPARRLAEDGHQLSETVHFNWHKNRVVKWKIPYITQPLTELFSKENGDWLEIGDLVVNKPLARTLGYIQQFNDTGFYEGELAKEIVKEVNSYGGILTEADLKNYVVKMREVFSIDLQKTDLTLHTIGSPGGGPFLAMTMNILTGYNLDNLNHSDINVQVELYHKLLESLKFSFAKRAYLGDPGFCCKKNMTETLDIMRSKEVAVNIRNFRIMLNETFTSPYYGSGYAKDDHGTTHLSVFAENGDAVASTNTNNYAFGSLIRSATTGIIYNNAMDDFSTVGNVNGYDFPPSPANSVAPGKRPLSSMTPSIVTDRNGDVKMVIGASGGSRITSAIAQVIMRTLYLGMDLEEAITLFRLHHQGLPEEAMFNPEYPPEDDLLLGLQTFGHRFLLKPSMSVVQAIYKDQDRLYAVCDYRKKGEPDGY